MSIGVRGGRREAGDLRQVRGFGVIDVKSYFVETPGEAAASIQLAAKEDLVITPDCGFNHCPRRIAFRKMKAMVEGARYAREF